MYVSVTVSVTCITLPRLGLLVLCVLQTNFRAKERLLAGHVFSQRVTVGYTH